MSAIHSKVFNRGTPPQSFLDEMIAWAKSAPDAIFDRTPTVGNRDVFNKVFAELGPYGSLLHRKAVMLEVMRVLAGFESSWKWREGVDASKSIGNTAENAEAGAWQASYDARRIDPSLADFLKAKGVFNGTEFQARMKADHPLAMEFVARLLRVNTKHNGPLYHGAERQATWPKRPTLWKATESIYPWLSRAAVAEFQTLLA